MSSPPAKTSQRRVRLVLAGEQRLGIFEDEIEMCSNWHPPTPLPGAPAGVLGVVCIRGRVLTILDLNTLMRINGRDSAQIVGLKGNEQIGLAVEEILDEVELADPEVVQLEVNPLLRAGTAASGESLKILNTKSLFGAAMRGHERRRRQF